MHFSPTATAALLITAFTAVATVADAGPVRVANLVDDVFVIDGQLGDAGWANAAQYTETFTSGSHTVLADVYLAHDGQFLYVGLDTPLGSGWDSLSNIRIDGDHDNVRSASGMMPSRDIIATRAAPNGWSTYNSYWRGVAPVSPAPAGYQSASVLMGGMQYEYKLPILDFATSTEDTVGLSVMIQAVANKNGQYLSPITDAMLTTNPNWLAPYADMDGWADLSFAPVPEPSSAALFGLAAAVGLAARSRRRRGRRAVG